MKDRFLTIFGTIVGIIALILVFATLFSCNHESGKTGFNLKQDSVLTERFEEYTNPEFNNIVEFTNYAKTEAEYNEFIQIVSKLHPTAIGQCAQDVISKHKTCDWKTFLAQYRSNTTLYSNISNAAYKLKDLPPLEEYEHYKPDTINVQPQNN